MTLPSASGTLPDCHGLGGQQGKTLRGHLMKRLLFLLLAVSVCCMGLTYAAIAQTKSEICDNKADDDDDKLVDCADPDCKCEEPPPPPPDGPPCSPGYWKNHETEFNAACQQAADLYPNDAFASCSDIMTALTCRGSDASCKRSAAAALMNEVTGCTE